MLLSPKLLLVTAMVGIFMNDASATLAAATAPAPNSDGTTGTAVYAVPTSTACCIDTDWNYKSNNYSNGSVILLYGVTQASFEDKKFCYMMLLELMYRSGQCLPGL